MNKERDNKITSVRNYFLIIYRKLGLTFLERSELVPVVTTSVKGKNKEKVNRTSVIVNFTLNTRPPPA